MVLKVFSVCLMVLDLDRKKVNSIHLWILCVQEPAGEMPNNFPTQSYLKINTRVFVTERAWRHQSRISGNLPGLGAGMMVRAETEVGTEGATNGFFYSQCRNGCDYLTLELRGLGWAELHNTSVCFSAWIQSQVVQLQWRHSQCQCKHWVSWISPTRLWTWISQMVVKWWLEQTAFWWWFTICCSLPWELWSHTDLRWFLWVNSFICWLLFFSNFVIMHYFCFLYFEATSSVTCLSVRHCWELCGWRILDGIGWDAEKQKTRWLKI